MADEELKNDNVGKPDIPTMSKDVSLTTAALFVAGVTVASMMGGFGVSLGMARKQSPDAFVRRHNEGVKLAVRALAYGSALAFGGVGVIVYGVKSALGVNTAKEFGSKMTEILPSKDGKLVTFFESWQLPRTKGLDDKEVESWFADRQPTTTTTHRRDDT